MGVRSLLLVTAALVGALLQPRFAFAQNPWEGQIQAYEAADRAHPPPLGSVVITGSSTIVGWTTIQTDLAPLDIIARGFGGSTADDLDYYLQRIVLVYKPRAVVIYEGDNDIVSGQSPTYVANRMAGILARITAALPNARVYVISIKYSPARVQFAAAEATANQLLAALCATDARYTYIDTASRLVNSSGTPIPGYFVSDGVHLSALGYQVWTAAIRPVLLPQQQIPMPADSVPPTAPTGLAAAAQSSSRIDLSWRAASDAGSGLAGYNVLRDGRSIASTTSIAYSDTGLTANTLYTYTVTAFDRMSPNRNESTQSAAASATTQTAPTPPPTVSLQVTPSSVAIGGATKLSWTSTNATSCTASGGWAGAQAPSGSATSAALSTNTSFTLTCTGPGGTGSDAKSVAVVGPPTVSLTLNPATIASGATTKLSWTSTNASSCSASGGWSDSKGTSGSETSSALATNTTFTLTCTGVGGSSSDSKTVTVVPAPTVSLALNPTAIAKGAKTQLSWTSANASSCSASGGWSGGQSMNGNMMSSAISANTTFTLSCTGTGGTASDTKTVTVVPAPTVSLTATPTTAVSGSTTQLSWTSTNATSCTASGGWSGDLSTSGTAPSSTLSANTTFTLTCTGIGGTATANAPVTVTAPPPPPPPTVQLSVDSATVAYGAAAKLTWSSTNATACTASKGWTGNRPPTGTETSSALTDATTFDLVCTGPSGTSSASVNVTIVYPEPTVTLNATPGTVAPGAAAKLSWTTKDASDCAASGGWNGKKALAGDEMTTPLATQSAFNLSCSGPGGSANATVMVQVQDAPSSTTSATPAGGGGGGGGGALDWWDVAGLLALLALRYRVYSATSTRLPSGSRK